MKTEITCGGVTLDCSKVVEYVKNNPKCSKDELMKHQVFKELLKEYAAKINHKQEVSWSAYEGFVDVVLDLLIQMDAIRLNFGVWNVKFGGL